MKNNNARGRSRSLAVWLTGGLAILLVGLLAIDEIYNQKEPADEDVANVSEDRLIETETVAANPPAHVITNDTLEIENGEVTPKEEMISELISSGRPIHDIAEDLLKVLPETQGSEQIIVASHLSNLAEGEQMNRLVGFLSAPNINEEAKEEIFSSIYDTEPEQVASLLIQVIEDGVEEYTDEAQKGLSILLQADHGMDVAAWKSELSESGNFPEAD